PSAGVSNGEIDTPSLVANLTGLTPSDYTCTLNVSDPAATNSPRLVLVRLFVGQSRLVPSQYSTIQAAIDACNDGDEVIVADGTYTGAGNKDLTLHGHPITVRSQNGPASSIIDCQGSGRGFDFNNESPQSVVRGFTVRNGNGAGVDGGGLRCVNSS